MRPLSTVVVMSLILAAAVFPAGAQTSTRPPFPIPYVLDPDTVYEEGCFGACLCVVFLQDGVKGGFNLDFAGFEPPFIVYNVTDIKWFVPNLNHTFTGSGQYRIGWRGTAQQELKLSLSEDGGTPVTFDSGLVPVKVPFPLIDISINMNGLICYDKVFNIKAAPAWRVALTSRVDPSSLSWDLFPDAPAYDAVFGSLSLLRASAGDFTRATVGCVASDVASSPVDASPDPPVGEAFWYLVRAYGGVAGMTYDAGDPGQGGTCDAQIDAAPNACP